MKNEKLASRMKVLNSKIIELEQYYYSISIAKTTRGLRISAKHQLNRAKGGFDCISEAYNELEGKPISSDTIETLVSESQRYCDDIDIYLFKISHNAGRKTY